MLKISASLFLGAAAMAMYLVASIQFMELVFDHYYRYIGLGIAVLGLTAGLAIASSENENRFSARIVQSPIGSIFAAVVAQVCAAYVAHYMTYGAGWAFLVLVSTLLVPYVFWGSVCSVLRATNQHKTVDKLLLITAAFVGLFASLWVVSYTNSLSALWLLSAALMALSMLPLAGRRGVVQGFFSLWVAAGLSWLAVSVQLDAYPRWDASAGTVTKPIAMALGSQKDLRIEAVEWLTGARHDRIVSSRSEKEGFGWQLVNGTAPVPFVDGAEKRSYEWWKRHFPLAVLPVEAGQPERMLSIGAVRGPDAAIAALKGVGEFSALDYSVASLESRSGLSFLSLLDDDPRLDSQYDLIQLSVPHPLKTVWVGANTQDEYLLSEQMLERYLALLNHGGMLAITAREESLFMKLLISVWAQLLPDATANIMQLENQLRIFRLNQYAPYKGSYSFLVLISPEGFSQGELQTLAKLEARLPIERLIYENQAHTAPYKYFDSLMVSHSLEDVQTHLSRYVGWRTQSSVRLLEPSSLEQPGFFRLSPNMHPFLKWVLTGVTGLLIYAVLFSYRTRRDFESRNQSVKPAIPVFLVQVIASSAATTFLLTSMVQPVISATRVPQGGFLWAIALILLVVVGTARHRAGHQQGNDPKTAMLHAALIMMLLLMMYFARDSVFSLVLDGDTVTLWSGVSLLLLVAGWFAWKLHQQVLFQFGVFHSLSLAWGWGVTGLGVLGASVISVQLAWSTMIIYAFGLYCFVLAIAYWASASETETGTAGKLVETA